MAKREIPEINAGSMADIAFLLLLFFLVTTTMDKDQAYIRKIPEKIEKKNTENQEIDTRNVFHIYANANNELILKDRNGKNKPVFVKDIESISELLYEWYVTNREFFDAEKLTAADKQKKAENQFPWYSASSANDYRIVKENYFSQIEDIEKLPEGERKKQEENLTMIYNEIQKAEEKRKLFKEFFGDLKVPELSDKAHIRIEVQEKTSYELFAKIQSEVEEAVYRVRDEECRAKFGESYEAVKGKAIQDEEKYEDDKKKWDLIDLLFPANIIEVLPKN
ncbi:MAG: hypothetical protein FJX80_05165 [Bacteroidetes bacterium]|nr:hypothetical protein [Bacteroidota bacterium]